MTAPIPEVAARLAKYEAACETITNMAIDLETEAKTIRNNKFRSHAYALEHERKAAALRALLADHASLTAERDRLAGALEPFRVACAAQMEHLQRMGLSPPDFETLGLHTFTVRDVRRAALTQPEHREESDVVV